MVGLQRLWMRRQLTGRQVIIPNHMLSPESTSTQERPPEDLLSTEEARALIKCASNRAPTGLRNRALIAMMYRVGLRPGEALKLGVDDLDLEAGTVRAPARKGGEPRLAGVDGGTVELLQRWFQRRERMGIEPDAPVFCTLAGEPIKAAYVRELLPRLARKAGIDKRVHPLGLRYACAAEMSAEGFPTAIIEAHLGVSAGGGARRYLRQYSDAEVIEAVRQREWRL